MNKMQRLQSWRQAQPQFIALNLKVGEETRVSRRLQSTKPNFIEPLDQQIICERGGAFNYWAEMFALLLI